MGSAKEKKPEEMSFEELLAKLEECAEVLRSGSAPLDESIEVYDKSIMYYKLCKEKLDSAKQKIEIYRPETGETEAFDEH